MARFELREALGDSRKAQQFIKTIHGSGFRFVADIQAARNLHVVLQGDGASEARRSGSACDRLERSAVQKTGVNFRLRPATAALLRACDIGGSGWN